MILKSSLCVAFIENQVKILKIAKSSHQKMTFCDFLFKGEITF